MDLTAISILRGLVDSVDLALYDHDIDIIPYSDKELLRSAIDHIEHGHRPPWLKPCGL